MWLCRYTRAFFLNFFYFLSLFLVSFFSYSSYWFNYAIDSTNPSFINVYKNLEPFYFYENPDESLVFCETPHLGKRVDKTSLDFLFKNINLLEQDSYYAKGFFYYFNASPRDTDIRDINFSSINDICFFDEVEQDDTLIWLLANRVKGAYGFFDVNIIYTIKLNINHYLYTTKISKVLFKALQLAYQLKKQDQFTYLVKGANPSISYIGYSEDLNSKYILFPISESNVDNEDSCIIFDNGDSSCTWEKTISECEREPLPDEPFSPNCRIIISDKGKGSIFDYVKANLVEFKIKDKESPSFGDDSNLNNSSLSGGTSSGGSSSGDDDSSNDDQDSSCNDNLLSCISDLTLDVKDSLLALKQDLLNKADVAKCSLSSDCPSIEISFWGETFSITIHCEIFENTGEQISKGFQFLWVFVAILIVLSA